MTLLHAHAHTIVQGELSDKIILVAPPTAGCLQGQILLLPLIRIHYFWEKEREKERKRKQMEKQTFVGLYFTLN